MQTFAAARAAILAYLAQLPGWTVKPNLKVPQAIAPNGCIIRFKAQAVYLDAHSMWLDIRTMTPGEFVVATRRWIR